MLLQVLMLWTVALIVSRSDFSDRGAGANTDASDYAAGLMWAGILWWLLRKALGPLSRLYLPGPNLSLERSAVCNNMGFIAHRSNEFMFLMLGETVLQIVVSEDNQGRLSESSSNSNLFNALFNATSATATAGLMLALAMMFSFCQLIQVSLGEYTKANSNVAERATKAEGLMAWLRTSTTVGSISAPSSPEAAEGAPKRMLKKSRTQAFRNSELAPITKKVLKSASDSMMTDLAAQRLLLRARAFNVVTTIFFMTNALSVLLVGVGIKLAINDPTAAVGAHFSQEQRLALGVPCMVVFSIQLVNTTLKNLHHYKNLVTILSHSAHLIIIFTRIVLLMAKVLVCFAPLQPVVLLCVEAVLGVLQCALLHMQEHRFSISSTRTHPNARLPDALHAIKSKAQRYRAVTIAKRNGAVPGGGSFKQDGANGGGGSFKQIIRRPSAPEARASERDLAEVLGTVIC